MKDQILKIVERETETSVSEETTIDSLNIDSLELLDIITAIEQETGKNIDDALISNVNTVGDLIRIAEAA